MVFKETLKSIDAHSSVSKEFRVYTLQGAIISVITVVLILYLVSTELLFNFQVTLDERVHVNATSSRGLELEFDISLPHVACTHISIDAADTTGQSQSMHLDREHHVWKHRFRLSEDGQHKILIGNKAKLELGSTLKDEYDLETTLDTLVVDDDDDDMSESQSNSADTHSRDSEGNVKVRKRKLKDTECGSCYGAGEEGECCNTCEDVKRAYKRRGWVIHDISEVLQCRREGVHNQTGEGCNVHGKVALSSGGGNLHLAPGKNYGTEITPSTSLFEMLLQSFQKWNVTHTVNKIRFGPEYPAAVYQLDGESRVVTDGSAMYQYYFQIVPTLYRFRNGTTIQTNQYSVTEHIRHVAPGSARGVPGIFFFYEVSPLHVEMTEGYRKGWIAFFTSVCAIIGGVVTFMGLVDQFLFTRKEDRRQALLS